jgi:hypothetical protein
MHWGCARLSKNARYCLLKLCLVIHDTEALRCSVCNAFIEMSNKNWLP